MLYKVHTKVPNRGCSERAKLLNQLHPHKKKITIWAILMLIQKTRQSSQVNVNRARKETTTTKEPKDASDETWQYT